ncbi:hypothetical protein [Rhodovulum sulfidophilum]|uniref:hypothetical protein n=1 Tax=Rhodovulum sulfidophilum TaxID=35806 RepID=UPI0009521D9E|nr:hypothetical protein [Rhodovulum sulfidophilum]MCE8459092.1 hypothetical protein [Rhodovulum sulfidophilum]OLS42779.1 hypothetical protein BV392_20155 [Rhodovulum sulfidophilum]
MIRIPRFVPVLTALALAPVIALVGPALAQGVPDTASGMLVELNAAAETPAGACRLTYVATNRSETGLSEIAYEVAVFDAEGIVSQLLVLDFGAMPPGKTRVVQFDMPDQPCEAISRIVVNAAPGCVRAEDGAQSPVCLDGLETRARGAIQFGL